MPLRVGLERRKAGARAPSNGVGARTHPQGALIPHAMYLQESSPAGGVEPHRPKRRRRKKRKALPVLLTPAPLFP